MSELDANFCLVKFAASLTGLILIASLLPHGVTIAQEPEALVPLSAEKVLLDGDDLNGWTFFCNDEYTERQAVWSVVDGVLKCTGSPHAYLQTKRWYRDYELTLQWRWPGEKGGNSGVLLHTTTPLVFYGWPKSIEVQMQSGSAGDFWVICKGVDLRVENEKERRAEPREGDQHSHRKIRRLPSDFENPVGEWNNMKVICRGNEIMVYINGDLANHGTQSTVEEGAIALQSEGTPVEFREIRLRPLED